MNMELSTYCNKGKPKLGARSDGSHLVAASAYGPTTVMRRAELCEDLRHLCTSFSGSPLIIGGDFNITLALEDRSHGLGGCDPDSAQLRLLLAHFGLQEMGPADRRFTWGGPTSQSRLDRFLCSIEMLERSPLAEVTSLPRPLSDHTPILWSSQVGMEKPPYFKLDRSWLRDATIKASIEEWWNSQIVFGPALERVTKKLTRLCQHLVSQRQQIRADRTRVRDASLARILALDVMEDSRPLTTSEARERKKNREDVVEVDLRVEMDWWQRSRQMWLAAGDANTKFFHQVANGRRRSNRIGRLRLGDSVITGHASVGQALAYHFRSFFRQGPPNS